MVDIATKLCGMYPRWPVVRDSARYHSESSLKGQTHDRKRLRVCHISLRRWPTDATDRFTPLNRCDRWVEPIVHEAEMETQRKHQQIENRPDKQQLLSLRAEFRLPSTHCEEAEMIKQVCERAEGLEL